MYVCKYSLQGSYGYTVYSSWIHECNVKRVKLVELIEIHWNGEILVPCSDDASNWKLKAINSRKPTSMFCLPGSPRRIPPERRKVKRRRFSNRSVALLKGLSNCFRINFLLMGKHLAIAESGRCCWTPPHCCCVNECMNDQKHTSLYRFLQASLWWHRKLHSQCCVYTFYEYISKQQRNIKAMHEVYPKWRGSPDDHRVEQPTLNVQFES